jgi:hypothetical protein
MAPGGVPLATQLDDTIFESIFIFNPVAIDWGPKWEPSAGGLKDWTDTDYNALRQSIEREVPEGLRDAALDRIAILDCASTNHNLASCNSAAAPPDPVKQWKKMVEAASVDREAYAKALVSILGDLVCSNDGDQIDVLRGLLKNKYFSLTGEELPALAKRITSTACPLSVALTDADKLEIAAVRVPIPPPWRRRHLDPVR